MILNLTSTKDFINLLNKPVTYSLEHSCKIMRRFEPRKNLGAGDCILCKSLFLCPKSILSVLKNLSLWWGGLSEQLLGAAVQTDFLPRRLKLEPLRGGLQLNQGKAAMRTSIQNSIKTRNHSLNTRLKSLFLLRDSQRKTIASGLNFEQIKPLSEHIKGSVICFDRMGEVA